MNNFQNEWKIIRKKANKKYRIYRKFLLIVDNIFDPK